ncbi:hypothetical protein BDZ90DRAFT_38888 [Jaminaea rosea]|uniref:Uncharacterized protein n=1 Tax=Jaminaea rosea TaxID=1569628 RepID=A0A316UTL7_9BASI|nr:hypothetical protein BDZ90DRAFT_38888 [Jaminaea rosea]PWN26435.1 hypothetical protein BDZ90DRAFT_38888 [Jaminaea rosea]
MHSSLLTTSVPCRSSNAWSRDDDDDGLPDDPSIARPTPQRAPPSSSTRHFKTQGSPSVPSLGAFADPLSPESAWASRGGSDAGTPKPTQEAQLSSIAPELVHHRGPNDADAMPLMSTNGPLDSSSESADEEAFVYQQQDAPPHENANGAHHRDEGNEEEEEEEEDFVYPSGTNDVVHVGSVTSSSPLPSEGMQGSGDQSKGPPRPRPRPIDYQRLHELCTSGSLESLQLFFQQTTEMTGTSSFALANEPNPSSGQMPIHYAAKQGKLDLLKWLVEDVGALVEIEDREGEVSHHQA